MENFVGIYENAFSKEYCDSVIACFDRNCEAGLTENRQQSGISKYKTEQDDEALFLPEASKMDGALVREFNDTFWNKIYPHYSDAFDILKTAGPHGNYHFKIQKTKIGGGYHIWHAESVTLSMANRLLVWTLYLNDVEEGGETEFLYYPKRIKPKTGTVIVWPAGFTHTHRGNPPISNTKYIVTGWIEF